jgi:hypothetical protein
MRAKIRYLRYVLYVGTIILAKLIVNKFCEIGERQRAQGKKAGKLKGQSSKVKVGEQDSSKLKGQR